MKYKKCEICGLRSQAKHGVKRFFIAKFPLDEDRCKEWVRLVGNEDLAYVPIEKLHTIKYVCGTHFEPRAFAKSGTQLKKNAVPRINLTRPPLSKEVLKEFPLRICQDGLEQEQTPEMPDSDESEQTTKMNDSTPSITETKIVPLSTADLLRLSYTKRNKNDAPANSSGKKRKKVSEKIPKAQVAKGTRPPKVTEHVATVKCTQIKSTIKSTAVVSPAKLAENKATGKLSANVTKQLTESMEEVEECPVDSEPMDRESTHEIETGDVCEESSSQYGQCRCCLKSGRHRVRDVCHLLDCFNIKVSSEPRLSRLVCDACGEFLQQARDFRNTAAASQATLLAVLRSRDVLHSPDALHSQDALRSPNALHSLDVDHDMAKDEAAPPAAGANDPDNSSDSVFSNSEMDPREHIKKALRETKMKNTLVQDNLVTILQHSTIVPFQSTKNSKLDCVFCNETYTQMADLRTHYKIHTNEEADTIHSIIKMVPQLIVRADLSEIKCRICNEQVSDLDELVQHLTNIHKMIYHNAPVVPAHSILPFKLSTNNFDCYACGETFTKYRYLIKHYNEHYGTFLCFVCGKKFIFQNAYTKHMLDHRDCLSCERCSEVFKNETDLQTHNKNCVFAAKVKSEHIKVESKIETFKCVLCDDEPVFESKKSAYMHRIGHLNYSRMGPYVCEFCGYIATVKSTLKLHLKSHYGFENFVCEVCNKVYKEKEQLSKHMQAHLDMKCQCPLCETVLANMKEAKNHLMVMHPEVKVEF